jgi:WD40 repeat protein
VQIIYFKIGRFNMFPVPSPLSQQNVNFNPGLSIDEVVDFVAICVSSKGYEGKHQAIQRITQETKLPMNVMLAMVKAICEFDIIDDPAKIEEAEQRIRIQLLSTLGKCPPPTTEETSNSNALELGWHQLSPEIDVAYKIISFLEVRDFPSCRQVCKEWDDVFQDDEVWKQALQRNFPYHEIKEGEICQKTYQCIYFNFQRGLYTLTTHQTSRAVVVTAQAMNQNVLCSGDSEGVVWVWDKKTFNLINSFRNNGNRVTAIAIEGSWFALGSPNGEVQLANWDAQANKLNPVKRLQVGENVSSLAIKGDTLFVGRLNSRFEVHDLITGTSQSFPVVSEGPSSQVAPILADGENLFIGSGNGEIRSYHLPTGPSSAAILGKHRGGISCLEISKDKNRLFSSAHDSTVKVWNWATKTCLATLGKEWKSRDACSFGLWGEEKVVVAHTDGEIKIWDWQKQTCEFIFKEQVEPLLLSIKSMFVEKGKLFVGRCDGKIMVYDATASHHEVLKDIVDVLVGNNPRLVQLAFERFERMPKAIKNGVFTHLYKALNITRPGGYQGNPEDAFYGRNGEYAAVDDILFAIDAYLEVQGEIIPQ